jgi:chromatin assembly factor 1 subunit A
LFCCIRISYFGDFSSPLPLSKLVATVREKLEEHHSKKWSAESIDAKIKILAKRRPVFNVLPAATDVNIFENEDEDRMWRWEVIAIEVLPSEVVSKFRKARSARKKLSSNHAALLKLLQTLENAELSIRDLKVESLDKLAAKTSLDEEKVLKFEREAEKKRLAEQAKRKKHEELEAKRKEKEILVEEKRKEKELKKQEAEKKRLELETKKQEQADAREASKRQKIEARERQEEERKQAEKQKKLSLNKQKNCLMSFFAAPKAQKSKLVEGGRQSEDKSGPESDETSHTSEKQFDVDDFRSQIDSYDSHAAIPQTAKEPPAEAIASRKRKTRKVDVSIYVTVIPDENNPFDAQPFAELKTLRVPNKYRFLSFREDTRPPYHGTWSKKSFIVTGRRPFAKDTSQLDYDYDSEVEWEEGDDEMGEDVEDEARNQEEEMEEGNDRIYDYDDGFCVADDRYMDTDENVDEEDKELYKKKLAVTKDEDAPVAVVNKIRVIAPLPGGLPCSGNLNSSQHCFEGFERKEGRKLLASLRGEKLSDPFLCLDAFPPPLNDEGEPKLDSSGQASAPANGSDEYTKEEMIILARFVHLNTLNSKEKIIEELRKDHLASFGSRAKATRKLDSIATKKRRSNATGVYWEVKKEIMEDLGLHDLVSTIQPTELIVEKLRQTHLFPFCSYSSWSNWKRRLLRTLKKNPRLPTPRNLPHPYQRKRKARNEHLWIPLPQPLPQRNPRRK